MDILAKLMRPQTAPCITISFNTHRTHPDNLQDSIMLKNLLRDAEHRLVEEFGKRDSEALIQKMHDAVEHLNMSFNLDSMHVFISAETSEVVKLPMPVTHGVVQIDESFAVRPLLKSLNRTENYLILLLSQAGTTLFEAVNDHVVREIETHGFPFGENPHYLTQAAQRSDTKRQDNHLREYLNTLDKALVEVHNETELDCVVVCVADNYHMLLQVADKPSVYLGHVDKHYKERQPHHIAADSWEFMETLLSQRRLDAIEEMKEAVGQSRVITDLTEIYRAAKEGRGDMLIARSDYKQAVRKIDDTTIELIDGANGHETVDDIMSELAMEVYTKKGRVIFADDEETNDLVGIAMKLRY